MGLHKLSIRPCSEMVTSLCGYRCNLFVESPPDYIKCGVCKNVLRNPQLTECCGRNVCHPCIKETIRVDGPCPLADCRRPQVKVSFNRICRNDIDERMVYCSSKENGCQWTDKLEKLERHLMECGFIEEVCLYCGTHVQQQYIEAHAAFCKQYPIECSQCGMTYERQHQSEHIKVCAFTMIKCPFSFVGCTSEVLNKDLPHHFGECLPDHYDLVEKLTQSLQTKAERIERLALQEYEKKTTELKAEIERLNVAISKARERISVLQQAMHEGEEGVKTFQKVQETTNHKFAAQIGVGTAEIEALKEGIKRLQFDSKIKLYGPPIPRPHAFDSHPPEMSPTVAPLIPPFAFTITNFEEKWRYNVVMLSPPFFTHRNGYKMLLQVHCNGNIQGRGAFVAIYAYLLRGEHDHSLLWPFCGSITVEIRNLLNNQHHHKRTIIFDIDSNAGARVEGDECLSPSKRLGYWNFMPLAPILPHQYGSLPSLPGQFHWKYINSGHLTVTVSKATMIHPAGSTV